MKKTIEIPIKWMERLVVLVDKVANEEDKDLEHAWFSHLIGYVHSMDEFLKKEYDITKEN